MNKTKRLFSIVAVCCILLSCFALGGCELYDPKDIKPTKEFYVNDFSDVLSKETEKEILSIGVALNETKETKGAQVVAVTVDSTYGEEISDYCVDLGRDWGIGNKNENNGVLILVATDDRNVWIATGYGLEGALPDSKVGRILDYYAIPDFKNDNFEAGLLKTYKAVVNEVYKEYGITPKDYVPVEELPTAEETEDTEDIVFSWVVIIVLIILYMLIFGRRGIFFFGRGGFGGFSGRYGGFSGGSGGGFGGFSGGGGSFGGGGAGRGF